MRSYPVDCVCGLPAGWKVAGAWSDGLTRELKTYALCCRDCLPTAFAAATRKCANCRTAEGETIEGPYVYERTPDGLIRRSEAEVTEPT